MKIFCWIAIIIALPFVLEFILFNGPSISHFSSEVWFSFLGSYIGSVVAIIVMGYTIVHTQRENIKAYERMRIREKYDNERREIEEATDFLLLNKISFSDINNCEMDLRNFIHELHTIGIKIKYAKKETKEKEKFYDFIYGYCILYYLSADALLKQFLHNKDKRYIMTEMRKNANRIREEVYKRRTEYLEFLEKEEKEKINCLF